MNFIEIEGSTDEKIKALENLNIQNAKFETGLQEMKDVVKYIYYIMPMSR